MPRPRPQVDLLLAIQSGRVTVDPAYGPVRETLEGQRLRMLRELRGMEHAGLVTVGDTVVELTDAGVAVLLDHLAEGAIGGAV